MDPWAALTRLNPWSGLAAAVVLQAIRDTTYKNAYREEARAWLYSPQARQLLELLDCDPEQIRRACDRAYLKVHRRHNRDIVTTDEHFEQLRCLTRQGQQQQEPARRRYRRGQAEQ